MICTNQTTRTVGALPDNDLGGPRDGQIDEAITRAVSELRSLVGGDLYDEVAGYDGDDADLVERRKTFERAEAMLACAHLPAVLRSAQMSEKGFVSEIEVGKAITRYGDPVLASEYESRMRFEATLLVEQWIDSGLYDDDGVEIGMRSSRDEISLMEI